MKPTTKASLLIAGGLVANVLALDNTVIDSYLTNHVYCPIRYAVEGFDRTDIERIDVAVYIDKELDEEAKRNCSAASMDAWNEYFREFGISLKMREPVEIDITKNVYSQHFESLDSDDDITIVFSSKRFWTRRDTEIGYSDPTQNVVFVYCPYYSALSIRNILIHEIGHLFYASHEQGENCYMNATSSPYNPNIDWCDNERSTIRMFKHKIW